MSDHVLPIRRRGRRAVDLLAACLVAAVPALGGADAAAARGTIVNPDGSGPVPWQVYMEAKSGNSIFSCGGAIRDALHVITAAHCVINESTGQFAEAAAIEAGVVHLSAPESTAQVRQATAAAVDPDFRILPGGGSPTSDAAVLTLEAPLDLSNAAVVDTLPPIEAGGTGTLGLVSGWGETVPNQQSPDALQVAFLDILAPSACANFPGFASSTMLCTGRINQNGSVVSPCSGDSGGPLARVTGTDSAGNALIDGLLGIVSWGPAECNAQAIFTNVGNSSINAFLRQSNPTSAPLRRIPAAQVAAGFRRLAGE